MSKKFTVYNFDGTKRDSYRVNEVSVALTASEVNKVRHHILIVDRSGSMSYDMPALRESLKKILALHEYNDDSTLVSLMSYSSMGDLTTHFAKKKVSEVKASEIDALRPTGLTCISQSLVAVRNLIDKNHITGITLHSDGYANDPNSFSEKKTILDICDNLSKEGVFVNTISHGCNADYQLLSGIANKVSGKCMRAVAIKDLYNGILQSFSELKNGSSSSIIIPKKDNDFLIYVSKESKKVVGSDSDMILSCIDPKDPGIIFEIKKISDQEASSLPEMVDAKVLFYWAKVCLAEGNINQAKRLLASSGDKMTFNRNFCSSTTEEIADFANDLEYQVFERDLIPLQKNIVVDTSVTVMSVLKLIEKNKQHITLDVDAFCKNYVRRGVKKIQGERDENGNVIEPWLETKILGDSKLGKISGLDISTTSANVSLNIVQGCYLAKKADGTMITQVAGVMLDSIAKYNNYNIVADGELVSSALPVYIGSKVAFEALKATKCLFCDGKQATDFDYDARYSVVLEELPVCDLRISAPATIEKDIKSMFKAKLVANLADSILKETSDLFTAEQIQELKKHYLSKSLYLNFPTINEYKNLDEAIAEGKVDVQTSYKVRYGFGQILEFGDFRSSNEFFDRMYKIDGVSGKLKTTMLLGDVNISAKPLSAKSKMTVADELQKEIFDALLSVKNVKDLAVALQSLVPSFTADEDPIVTIKQCKDAAEDLAEELYMTKIMPVVFYLGSFGMIPDEWNVRAISAEDLKKEWPDVKVSKSDSDGIFYKVGNVVFGVTTERRYVTIGQR